MKKLTEKQTELLCNLCACEGGNTHQIAAHRGDRQNYESNLRDRLFRLAERGLARYFECVGKSGVTERRWYLTEQGRVEIQ